MSTPEIGTQEIWIYGLLDADGTVRYVGTTTNLQQRIRQHRATLHQPVERDTPATRWLKLQPTFPDHVVLEHLRGTLAEGGLREAHWISQFPAAQLVNVYREGRFRRVPMSPEAIANMTRGRQGWSPSAETRRRSSETRRGVSKTETHRQKISVGVSAWIAANSSEPLTCPECGRGPFRGQKGLNRHKGSCR